MMETVWRVAIIYLFIVFGLRVLGKREFGQLSPLELVMLLLIPELVTHGMIDEDFSLVNALVGLSTLLLLVYFTSLLQHKWPRTQKIFSGTPTVLVQHGYYIDKHMNQERVGPEEIFDAIHHSGLERLEQVKWAILESDGKIAIVPAERPITQASLENREKPVV